MNIHRTIIFVIVLLIQLICPLSLGAGESDDHKEPAVVAFKIFSEKELNAIKASNNPNLIMGAGILYLSNNLTSSLGRELLELASRAESPKSVTTISLIIYRLNQNQALPLSLLRENIVGLLKDENENALPYYLNALLLQEEGKGQKALDQIKKGNVCRFSGYTKERFYAIVHAAEMAKWDGRHSRKIAFWNSNSSAIYFKLRHLCRALNRQFGQEAKEACMNLGRNLEVASLTCLDRLTSLAIQGDSLNDMTSDDITRSEITKRRKEAFGCGGCTTDVSEADITDEADKQYYEILLEEGETRAQEFIKDFVEHKLRETGKSILVSP